ncbi:HlyC/CorC family transporter [Neobacillus sp. MM2021_6]|uniref:hemolysin family protein n=1 Tax=Bacillus sp. MM2020_4 TaxID=2714039 RepID=UPI00140AD10E|nr:hemolysin family protein [Bacillus sp. MM2020_4]MBO0960447.1 HlyC/CorC family transporter [Neobacillus sp. MM2021_6]NHC16696.1 HlyC/CorC family transporter [Bacillus sp. MM2020_4]
MDIINLFIIAILIALTAFFVAVEFAIVKVRGTRIDQLMNEGKRGAQSAKQVVTHLDEYLSACQLGITVTALGIGWLGEPTVSKLLEPLFNLVHINHSISHILSMVISFALVTFINVVVGELAPKSFAIQKAETVTLLFARPMIWFYKLFYPFIWLLNTSSRKITGLFGLKPASENELAHSEDELRIILSESYQSGEINESELTYVNNVFDFNNRIAKEIMVPRTEMVGISIDDQPKNILSLMKEQKYTRYPVINGDKDNIIGIVNIKDILTTKISNDIVNKKSIKPFVKPVISVIETIPIQNLLLKMQKERTHMAILLDEFGGTSGIVTVEDILEEIVGEIRDEFDADEVSEVRKIKDQHYIISGKVLIETVNDLLGTSISNKDLDTIGGWFLSKKFDAEIGDSIELDGFSFRIKEMEEHHILFMEIQKLAEQELTFPEKSVS